MHWTTEQILALADAGSAKRGQGLAKTSKWVSLQTNGKAAWGLCKGSGKNPYQTAVDFEGPAFKCSCPSRKFPCKHGIGLLLLANSDTDAFQVTEDVADWADSWLKKRHQKTEPKTEEKSKEDKEKAAQQKAKNQAARMKLMESGIRDLEVWLMDLMRMGLAAEGGSTLEMTSSQKNYYHSSSLPWGSIAQRMVDAKLGGIGRNIRSIADLKNQSTDWHTRVLEKVSELYLLIEGFKKLKQLPADYQQQILAMCGVSTSKNDVLASEPVSDKWLMLHVQESQNIDNAKVREAWCLGEKSGRFAKLLDFDYGMGFSTIRWVEGKVYQGNLHYYPSLFPLRGLLEQPNTQNGFIQSWDGEVSIDSFLVQYATNYGKNPWLSKQPVAFSQVITTHQNEQFFIVDAKGKALPLEKNNLKNWKIFSMGGGHPIDVFGEWNGEILTPLSVVSNQQFAIL